MKTFAKVLLSILGSLSLLLSLPLTFLVGELAAVIVGLTLMAIGVLCLYRAFKKPAKPQSEKEKSTQPFNEINAGLAKKQDLAQNTTISNTEERAISLNVFSNLRHKENLYNF